MLKKRRKEKTQRLLLGEGMELVMTYRAVNQQHRTIGPRQRSLKQMKSSLQQPRGLEINDRVNLKERSHN